MANNNLNDLNNNDISYMRELMAEDENSGIVDDSYKQILMVRAKINALDWVLNIQD